MRQKIRVTKQYSFYQPNNCFEIVPGDTGFIRNSVVGLDGIKYYYIHIYVACADGWVDESYIDFNI